MTDATVIGVVPSHGRHSDKYPLKSKVVFVTEGEVVDRMDSEGFIWIKALPDGPVVKIHSSRIKDL